MTVLIGEKAVKVKTVSVTYGRKLNLGNYESARSEITVWADIDPDTTLTEEQIVDGLREFARNQVLVELSKHKGADIKAKMDEVYKGLPPDLQEVVHPQMAAFSKQIAGQDVSE